MALFIDDYNYKPVRYARFCSDVLNSLSIIDVLLVNYEQYYHKLVKIFILPQIQSLACKSVRTFRKLKKNMMMLSCKSQNVGQTNQSFYINLC